MLKRLCLAFGLRVSTAPFIVKDDATCPRGAWTSIRYPFLGALALATTACVTPAKFSVGSLAASASTPVIDMRPASEGQRESFSLIITSERYGYFRVAQESTDPTGARIFAHRLQEKFSPATAPPTSLRHLVVYANSRTELKRFSTVMALGGIVGGMVANAGGTREGNAFNSLVNEAVFNSMSGGNEFKRAIYDNSEAPPTTSAYVIYIETESQGARRFTRTVWPIKKTQAKDANPLPEALESAIAFHLKE